MFRPSKKYPSRDTVTFRREKNLVIANMDSQLMSFNTKGKKIWQIKLPTNVTCIEQVDIPGKKKRRHSKLATTMNRSLCLQDGACRWWLWPSPPIMSSSMTTRILWIISRWEFHFLKCFVTLYLAPVNYEPVTKLQLSSWSYVARV
jgi:hypothetical protein